MPKEIEVKILDIDVQEVVKRIEELGGKKTFEGEMSAAHYDFPKGDPHELDSRELMLRIRKEGDQKIEMTLKAFSHVNPEVKDSTEYPVSINDWETMEFILLQLGMKVLKRRTKTRISYHIPNTEIHYDFDTLPGCKTYLEVETQDKESLEKAVIAVGFTMADTKPWNQTQVEEYYGLKT